MYARAVYFGRWSPRASNRSSLNVVSAASSVTGPRQQRLTGALEFVARSPFRCALALGVLSFVLLVTGIGILDAAALTRQIVAQSITIGGTVAGIVIMVHPAVRGFWWLARNPATGQSVRLLRIARRGWRLLVLSGANVVCAAIWQSDASSGVFEFVKLVALAVGVWLVLLVTWPCIDAALAKLMYVPLAGARHPTPREAARIDPVLAQLAPVFGLEGLPWVLVRQGEAREDGQGFNSVVCLGATAIAEWPDDALHGLVAHELAHVALDHGRQAANLAVWLIAFWSAVAGFLQWVSSRLEAEPPVMAGLVLGLVLPLAWLALQPFQFFFAVARDNYPCEVEADALAIERGYAEQLEATLLRFPDHEPRGRFWPWLLRTHPSPAERLAKARAGSTRS
jgi:Zn-dependent protease with chaperone function